VNTTNRWFFDYLQRRYYLR